MQIRSLFPTRIGETEPLDVDEIANLQAAIWMLEDGDTAGHEWCEREGYAGYTSYASLDDLPSRATAFGQLKEKLDAWAAAYASEQNWDLREHTLSLDAMWVNVLGEGGSHSGHIHPGSVISGTTYISIPSGSGALKLEDPRLAQMMAAPPLTGAAPRYDAYVGKLASPRSYGKPERRTEAFYQLQLWTEQTMKLPHTANL